MSQSLARNIVHLIFSTKERRPLLNDAVRPRLHAYATGILADEGCFTIAINSVSDHMHILFELNKTLALSTAVQNVKQGTSRWIKNEPAPHNVLEFQWQNGYGAFSVSASNVNGVVRYIAAQAEHHKKTSFQDELRAFLKRHSVAYDERYLWE